MKMSLPLLVLVLVSFGCHPVDVQPDPSPPEPTPDPGPSPDPEPQPEDSPCAQMCATLENLGCEEGEPLYDSDLPGPRGEPNQTCTGFCEKQMANGLDLKPLCVAKVTSCDLVEPARDTCEE